MRVLLVCPNCWSEALVPKSQVKFGLMCPGCHTCKMRPPRKSDPGTIYDFLNSFSPAGRMFLFAALLAPVALFTLPVGVGRLRDRAGLAAVQPLALGAASGGGAVACFVVGVNRRARDRRDREDDDRR